MTEGYPETMLRVDSCDYDDIICDSAVLLILDEGLGALNSSRIAKRLRMTPPALVNRYRTSERVLQVVVRTAAARWSTWVERPRWDTRDPRPGWGDLLGLLPENEDERAACVAWAGVRTYVLHVGRADPTLATFVDEVAAVERGYVARSLTEVAGRAPEEVELDAVVAAVLGLRDGVGRTSCPMDVDAARQALNTLVEALVALPSPISPRGDPLAQ